MVVSSVAILIIFNLGTKKNHLIPDKIQLLAELSYSFVSKMISDTAGSKQNLIFHLYFHYLCLFFFATCLEWYRTLSQSQVIL